MHWDHPSSWTRHFELMKYFPFYLKININRGNHDRKFDLLVSEVAKRPSPPHPTSSEGLNRVVSDIYYKIFLLNKLSWGFKQRNVFSIVNHSNRAWLLTKNQVTSSKTQENDNSQNDIILPLKLPYDRYRYSPPPGLFVLYYTNTVDVI